MPILKQGSQWGSIGGTITDQTDLIDYIESHGGDSGTPFEEPLAGTIDGTNTVFTFSHTPIENTQSVYVNGVFQSSISDYALSGTTITFTVAPTSPSILIITYQY